MWSLLGLLLVAGFTALLFLLKPSPIGVSPKDSAAAAIEGPPVRKLPPTKLD